MNMSDLNAVTPPAQPALVMHAIFEHQSKLMTKYDEIEAANGFMVPHAPYNLNDKFVQERVKALAWRTTEEMAEAIAELRWLTPATLKTWKDEWDRSVTVRNMFEEWSDVLHFLTELSIIAGITPEMVNDISDYFNTGVCRPLNPAHTRQTVEQMCGNVVWAMGMACNCLKNKPWKMKQVITDEVKFKNTLLTAWLSFGDLFSSFDMPLHYTWAMYLMKNQVNQSRQASAY